MIAMLALAIAAGGAPAAEPIEVLVAKTFAGFELDSQAEGDLDGDGRKDAVVTAKKAAREDDPDSAAEALLAVFLRGPDGQLHLHTRAPDAVCVGCGGAKASFSEVLGTPRIDRGVLSVSYEGGSRQMWSYVFKWRRDRKSGRFVLIGQTLTNVDTLAEGGKMEPGELSHQDINYVTGKMIRKVSGQGTWRCDVKPGLAAPDLASFDFQARTEDTDKFVKGSCKR